jgi:hypothetical protein
MGRCVFVAVECIIIIHFMECIFYTIYAMYFAVTCVQLSCMREICFSGFNLCVQLIVCSFFFGIVVLVVVYF